MSDDEPTVAVTGVTVRNDGDEPVTVDATTVRNGDGQWIAELDVPAGATRGPERAWPTTGRSFVVVCEHDGSVEVVSVNGTDRPSDGAVTAAFTITAAGGVESTVDPS